MAPTIQPLRVYLDEDVDVLLAALLGAHGIDVQTTQAAGNLHRSDEEQLTFAFHNARIIVTHNRTDFLDLAIAWDQRRDHAGIVLALRRADTYDLARRLLPVLKLYDQTEWRNKTLYA